MIRWDFPSKMPASLVSQTVAEVEACQGNLMFSGTVLNWDTAHPLVELKSDFPEATLLIVVALDGWDYKRDKRIDSNSSWRQTKGYQVRLSANGVTAWKLEHFLQLQENVEEAYAVLRALQTAKGPA